MYYIYNNIFIIYDSKPNYIESYFKKYNHFYIKYNNKHINSNIIKKNYCNTIYIINNINKFYNILNNCSEFKLQYEKYIYLDNYIFNEFNYLYNSSLNESNDNLLIESIDYNYPILIKIDNIILYKINNSSEFCKYINYIRDYSYNNYNSKSIYFHYIDNNCLIFKLHVYIFNNNFIILDIFKFIYIHLSDYILYSDYNFYNKYYKILLNKLKSTNKSLYINNIILNIDFILLNKEIYFYKIDFNFDFEQFYNYYLDVFNINIFDILIFNKQFSRNSNHKFNYFLLNNKFYKDFNYKKVNKNIKLDKSLIENIKLETNICKIYNNKNIIIKKPENCIDNFNSYLSNIIINNKLNDEIIEIYNNISLYFYNNCYICITGNNLDININNNFYKTHKIIKINKFDYVKIDNNNNNYYYLSIYNGIKSVNFNNIIFNKTKINNNFNIITNIEPIYNNKIYCIYDKNEYDRIFKKYKWKINEYKIDKIIIKSNIIFNIRNIFKKIKYKKIKYPIGSIILLENNNILIIRNINFNYIKGLYIGCIINCDICKLNYIKNINFINISYNYANHKDNIYKNYLLTLENNNKNIIKTNYNDKLKDNNYLFIIKDKIYEISKFNENIKIKYLYIIL